MGRKTHTFDSQAQEKWAFSTRQPWAHRWGENTKVSGKPLPARKKPPKSAYRTARSLMSKAKG